jgi:acyl-CoA thioester hydrolase
MDLDAYGHVGNSRYYDYMTDARVEAFGAKLVMSDLSKQYVVVKSSCEFIKGIHYPGDILVKQYCTKVGNSSFDLEYEFYMADAPEKIYARGALVMVCFDAKLGRAVRLPQVVRDMLA